MVGAARSETIDLAQRLAIARSMLRTLEAADGSSLLLGSTPVWVEGVSP